MRLLYVRTLICYTKTQLKYVLYTIFYYNNINDNMEYTITEISRYAFFYNCTQYVHILWS